MDTILRPSPTLLSSLWVMGSIELYIAKGLLRTGDYNMAVAGEEAKVGDVAQFNRLKEEGNLLFKSEK